MTKRKLFLYGSGNIGKEWLNKIGTDKVFGFIDSNPEKSKEIVCGKKIYWIEDIKKSDDLAIFIATSYLVRDDIKNILIKMGLDQYIVSAPYFDDEKLYVSQNAYIDPFCELGGKNKIYDGTILQKTKLGIGSYVGSQSYLDLVSVGKYCSIASEVKNIRGNHPTESYVSTYPAFYSMENETVFDSYVSETNFIELKKCKSGYAVEIGNDVWIGQNVRILDGVSIGDGAIIAAGAVVTKNVEPYTIVGGVPAKYIKKRFTNEQIDFLLAFKWWDRTDEWIRENANLFKDIDLLMDKYTKTE